MVNSMFVLYLFSYRVDVVKVPIVNNVQELNFQIQQPIAPSRNKIISFNDATFGRMPEWKQTGQAQLPMPLMYPNMASTPFVIVPVMRHASRQQDTLTGMYHNMANSPNMVMPAMKQQYPLQIISSNMARTPIEMMPTNQPSLTHFPLPVASPLRLLPILHSMPVMNQQNQPQSSLFYPNMHDAMMPVMKQPSQSPYSTMFPSLANTPNIEPARKQANQPQLPLRIWPTLHTMPLNQPSYPKSPLPVMYPELARTQDMMMPFMKQPRQPQSATPIMYSSMTNTPNMVPINQLSHAQSTLPVMYPDLASTQDMMMPARKQVSQPQSAVSIMYPSITNTPNMPMKQFSQSQLSSPLTSPLRILPILHTMPVNNQPNQPHFTLPGSSPMKDIPISPVNNQLSQNQSPWTVPISLVNNQQSPNQLPWTVISSFMNMPNTPDVLGPTMTPPNQLQATNMKGNMPDLLMPLIKQICQSQLPTAPLSTPTATISINKQYQPHLISNPNNHDHVMIMGQTPEDITPKVEPPGHLDSTSPVIDIPDTPDLVVPEVETLPALSEASGLPSVPALPTVEARPMSTDLKHDFKEVKAEGPVYVNLSNSVY